MSKTEDFINELELIHSQLIFIRDALKLKGESAFELTEHGFLGFSNIVDNIANSIEKIFKTLYASNK